MAIIASAPVPAGSRLVDADTVDLAAVRRPRSAAFLTELGRRVDHLFAAGMGDQLAEHARALGSTEAEALAAWDAYRRSLTAPADTRFPVNTPYRSAGEHAATCPPWCPGDCAPEVELSPGTDPAALNPDEYFDRCRMHERFVANVRGTHAEVHSIPMHNAVEMERFDGPDGKVVEPTSITLAVMTAAPKPGDEMAKSRLTPEQADELGRALIEAARLARSER